MLSTKCPRNILRYGLVNSQRLSQLGYNFSTWPHCQQARQSALNQSRSKPTISSIPDTLSKNPEKFIHLTSVDQFLNKDSVNWDRVSIAFQTYYQRKDHKSGFRLANRIVDMNLIPPPNVVGFMLRLLADQDMRLSALSILQIFETSVQSRVFLSDLSINTLIWSMRQCHDPFARAAFLQLFKVYFEYATPKQQLGYAVQNSFLHSLVESGELEEARALYDEIIDRALKEPDAATQTTLLENFPWNSLFESAVSKWSEASFGLTILKHMDQLNLSVPSHFWHLLLESSIAHRDNEILDYVWKKAYQTGKITLADSSLRSVFQLFIEESGSSVPLEALQKLALQDPSGLATNRDLSKLIDIYLTSPTFQVNKPVTLQSILQSVQRIHDYMPKSDLRDLDQTCEVLWNLIQEQKVRPEDLVGAVVEAGRNGESPESLTFVMNFVLRACNQTQAASMCFYLYRSLIQKGAIPDTLTFEYLAFAALCLGNSKKLGYLIYQECEVRGSKPSRRMIELLIRGSLKGSDFTSTLFYISRLQNPRIELSQHLMQHLTRSFASKKDSRLQELLSNPLAVKGQYADFPSDSTLERSASPGSSENLRYSFYFDKGNSYRFVHGWPLKDLARAK